MVQMACQWVQLFLFGMLPSCEYGEKIAGEKTRSECYGQNIVYGIYRCPHSRWPALFLLPSLSPSLYLPCLVLHLPRCPLLADISSLNNDPSESPVWVTASVIFSNAFDTCMIRRRLSELLMRRCSESKKERRNAPRPLCAVLFGEPGRNLRCHERVPRQCACLLRQLQHPAQRVQPAHALDVRTWT